MAQRPAESEALVARVRPLERFERVYVKDLSAHLGVTQVEIRRWGNRHKCLIRVGSRAGNPAVYWLSLASAVRAIIHFRSLQGAAHLEAIASGRAPVAKRRDERE